MERATVGLTMILQLVLCVLGLWWLSKKAVRVGSYELTRPGVFFVGLILFLQAPMAVFVGSAVLAGKAAVASKDGAEPDVKKLQKKIAWVDPAVTGGAAVLAGLIAVAIAKRPEPEVTDELLLSLTDDVVGVRDHVREQREREEAERVRRQASAVFSDRVT